MRLKWLSNWSLWIGLLVFVAVGWNGLRWSKKIPYDGAPDEADHYLLEKFVADHGRLPRYGEEDFAVHVMGRGHRRLPPSTSGERLEHFLSSHGAFELRLPYLFSPQMPYWLAGMYCRSLGGISVPKARSFNTLCVALAAVCTYGAGLMLWGKPWAAAIAALCFGFWPQVSFISAYVNDDAYAVFAVGFLLFAAAGVQRHGLDRRRAAVMGTALGALAAAKFYVYALFPLLLLWWFLLWKRHGTDSLKRLALSLGIATVIAGPWIVRNAILYDGDLLGRRTAALHAQQFIDAMPPRVRAKTHILFTQQEQGLTLRKIFERGFFRRSLESFWGLFRWMDSRMKPEHYRWALYTVAGALVLSLIGLPFLRGSGGWQTGVPHLFALPYLALLMGLALYNCYFVDYQPQGRYLLTSVPALCLQFLDVPARGRRLVPAIGCGLLAFFVYQNLVAFQNHLH